MKLQSLVSTPLLLLPLAAGLRPGKRILLSQTDTLTLVSGQVTEGRRLAPIPQLKCVGGGGMGKYEVDVMQCSNVGRLVSGVSLTPLPRYAVVYPSRAYRCF